MSLEFELYEEKRRKMRRFSFLKGSLVTIIIIVIAMVIWNKDLVPSPHIAMFEVVGEIYDDSNRDRILNEIAEIIFYLWQRNSVEVLSSLNWYFCFLDKNTCFKYW